MLCGWSVDTCRKGDKGAEQQHVSEAPPLIDAARRGIEPTAAAGERHREREASWSYLLRCKIDFYICYPTFGPHLSRSWPLEKEANHY